MKNYYGNCGKPKLKNTINIKNNSVGRINSRLDKLKRRLFGDKSVEYNKIKVRKVKERKQRKPVYTQNYKILLRDTKESKNSWRDIHRLENSIMQKYQSPSNLYLISMKSQLKFQTFFHDI